MNRRNGWAALPGLAVLALAALAPQGAGAAPSNWAAGLAAASSSQARGGTLGSSTPTASCSGLIGTTVNLSWAAVTGATSYAVIQTKTPPLGTTVTATIASVSAPTTAYSNTGLAAGNYTYQVQASAGTKWLGAVSAASAQRSISLGLLCT